MSADATTVSAAPRKPRSRLVSNLLAWGASLLVLAAAVVVVAYGASRPEKPLHKTPPKLANTEVITLAPEVYDETLVLPAKLMADHEATVSPELSGTLASWLVEEGAQVKRGQPVATLDATTLDAQLAERTAEKRSAEATAAVAAQRIVQAGVALDQSRQQLTVAQLGLDAATSSLELASKELQRARSLFADHVTTQAELDVALDRQTQAKVALDRAREAKAAAELAVRGAEVQLTEAKAGAELEQAKIAEHDAKIASLKVQLGKTKLLAAVDGRLEKHLVQAGEVVAPGQVLANIYDLAFIRARVDVADRYVPFLTPKDPTIDAFIAATMPGARRKLAATLVLPGLPKLTGGTHPAAELPAEISYVSQSSDPNSNTFQVELRLPNPSGTLRQGIIAQARITYLTYPEALVIPMRAVQVSDLGPRVLVVVHTADNRDVARVRDIVPISIQNDRILVTGGLSRGDQLLVAGGKGLIDGEQVRVVVKDGQLAGEAAGAAEAPPAPAERQTNKPVETPAGS